MYGRCMLIAWATINMPSALYLSRVQGCYVNRLNDLRDSCTQCWLSLSRVCISLSHVCISCTFFMRRMSQIFVTAFKYMFDGRQTKKEKLDGEVGTVELGEKGECCVTYRM
jgi:hypothetical protein